MIMVFFFTALALSAQNRGKTADGFYSEWEDGKVTVFDYDGGAKSIRIPASIVGAQR
jgi:hypothetical protein